MTHTREERRLRTSRRPTTKQCLATDPRAALVPALATTWKTRRVAPCDDDPPTARTNALDTLVPDEPEQALRHQGRHQRRSWTTATSSRCSEHYAAEHRRRASRGSAAVPSASSANQPAVLAGCLDIDASHQGRALRALLRLLQHPARHVRRRARLPAGHGAGVRRHHHARRQAALCVLRSDRAEGDRHHAQGLRRRVRRDGVASTSAATSTSPIPTAEIAVMGPDGAVNIIFTRRDPQAEGPGRGERRSSSTSIASKFANPYKAAELGYIDEVIMPGGHAAAAHPGARDAAEQARQEPPEEAREHPTVRGPIGADCSFLAEHWAR